MRKKLIFDTKKYPQEILDMYKLYPYNVFLYAYNGGSNFVTEEYIDSTLAKLSYENCMKVLEGLTEREQVILQYRYDEGLTFKAIGERLGVSTERPRQIEAKAIRKLRHPSRRFQALGMSDTRKVSEMEIVVKNLQLEIKNLNDTLAEYRSITQAITQAPQILNIEHNATIADLNLSVRTFNVLRRAVAYSESCGATISLLSFPIAEFVNTFTVRDLMKLRNMGTSSASELIYKLYSMGFMISAKCSDPYSQGEEASAKIKIKEFIKTNMDANFGFID